MDKLVNSYRLNMQELIDTRQISITKLTHCQNIIDGTTSRLYGKECSIMLLHYATNKINEK